ncbi:TlpA disulfide reductase family protein [Mucilaginibacter panaciglaebae]|uniref:TlpA disulfide reductase family protein n=1 Tax=Mucilaginibacter panaciglaebae TaxID=502331 RepID=A0ABP7X2B0_9SPHI
MGKLTLLFLLLLLAQVAFSQNNLIIKGKAPLLKDGTKINIEKIKPRRFAAKTEVDSTYVKGHQFEFRLKNNNGEYYDLTINKYHTRLYLQPGMASVTLADSLLRNVTVSNNLMADENNQFLNQVVNDSVYLAYRKINADYSRYARNKKINKDTLAANRIKRDELLELFNKEYGRLVLEWIRIHPASYLNSYLLYNAHNQSEQSISEEEVKHVFAAMPINIKHNIWGSELKYRIDSLFVGGNAPDFAQADTNGKIVKLTDFKGKYVLIDFWASWCLPCRAQNPAVLKVSQQLAMRNFTILGISLDSRKDSWLRAIKQDGLNWTQLSDLRYWGNGVSVNYYVYDIPANYLIDPNGKIIAKNINSDVMLSTLKRIIK